MITTQSLKVLALTFPIIAGFATLIRLFERYRRAKLGWDDGFAALSLIILTMFVIAFLVHVGDPTKLSQFTRFALYYVIAEGFYGVIWTARLSILFTIIRISPAGGRCKKILYAISASYLVIWVILSAQLFWVCERLPGWKDTASPQCPLDYQVPVAQLISDVYADAILVVVPLKMLWSYRGSLSQRIRLIFSFSASIITTITSLVHSYYIVSQPGSRLVLLTAVIELSASLFVCNLTVLFCFFSRLLNACIVDDTDSDADTKTSTRETSELSSPMHTLTGWASTFRTQLSHGPVTPQHFHRETEAGSLGGLREDGSYSFPPSKV